MKSKLLAICLTLVLCVTLPIIASATNANRKIVFDSTSYTAYVGKQQRIVATVERVTDDAPQWTNLVWSSSDETVARVDAYGNVSGVTAGTVTIQAKAQDDESVIQTAKVTVHIPVSRIGIATQSATLLVGADEKSAKLKLECVVEPEGAFHKKVIWTSSNENVAVVDENGIVTALSRGYVTITAKSTDPTMPWLSSSCQISVGQAVTGISLNSDEFNIPVGNTVSVSAKILPSDASNQQLTWTSSNENVAKVSAYGSIQGVSTGDAVITATAKDGSGIAASCKVTVVSPVKKISFEEKSISIPVDESLHLVAIIEPEDATIKDVVWTSSNEKVVTVDEFGVITGVANGNATITVAAVDGSNVKVSIPITVEDFDLIFTDKKPQNVKYYYDSGRFTITGSVKTGNVSIPDMYIRLSAVVVGGLASDDVEVTPVNPGADVVTIKVNSKNYTYKVFVSEKVFPDFLKSKEELNTK